MLVLATGRELDPKGLAPVFAGTLYAAIPIIAMQSRVVKEDSAVALLALLAVWLYLRWKNGSRASWILALSAVACGLAVMAKIPAVAFPAALVALLVRDRQIRAAMGFTAVSGAVASLLVVYAVWHGWAEFIEATEIQANVRALFFDAFIALFDVAEVNANKLGVGWLLFLWIAAFAAASNAKHRKHTSVLTIPLVAYTVAIALPSGTWHFGWYFLPLYPFLCLLSGRFLEDAWHSPELLRGLAITGLLVLYGFTFFVDPERQNSFWYWPVYRERVTWIVLAFIVPFGLAHVFRTRLTTRLAQLSIVAAMVAVLVTGAYFAARFDRISLERQHYDRGWRNASGHAYPDCPPCR
jgi:4-amino-4-deoxy-L-arabinose transferase-like glycosyltransferase